MASAHVLTVTGTVSFREQVDLSPGAVATVKLVDTGGEVLAATAVETAAVPAEFVLHVDPGFVADPDQLLIWAALRSDVGVWGTTDLVAVEGDSVDVVLTKIDG